MPKCCFKHPSLETNLLFQNSVTAAKNKLLSIMRKIRIRQQWKAQYFSSVSPKTWTPFLCPVSSGVKELFPSDTGIGVHLGSGFLLESCWQSSPGCGWIQHKFGHRGFSKGWDSWQLTFSLLSPCPLYYPDWKWGIIPLIPWFPDPKLSFLKMQRNLCVFLLFLFKNHKAKNKKAEIRVVFCSGFFFCTVWFEIQNIY